MISSPDDDEVVEDFIIPASSLTNSSVATIYVSFSRSTKFTIVNFTNVLKFTSREIDPETGDPEEKGYDDEYEVDILAVGAGDYFLSTYVGNFQQAWDSFVHEASDTFALSSMKSLQGLFSLIVQIC